MNDANKEEPKEKEAPQETENDAATHSAAPAVSPMAVRLELPVVSAAKSWIGRKVTEQKTRLVQAENELGAALEENLNRRVSVEVARKRLDNVSALVRAEQLRIQEELDKLESSAKDRTESEELREERKQARKARARTEVLEAEIARMEAERRLKELTEPSPPPPSPSAPDPVEQAFASLDLVAKIEARAELEIRKIREAAGGDDKLTQEQRDRIARIEELRDRRIADVMDGS